MSLLILSCVIFCNLIEFRCLYLLLIDYAYVFIFQQKYNEDPLRLFLTIKYCLDTETKLVVRAENLGQSKKSQVNNDKIVIPNEKIDEIKDQFSILRQHVCETTNILRRMEEEQQEFSILYNEYTKVNAANVQQLSSHNQMELEKEIKR